MQRRIRLQKMLIFGLAVVISILLVSLLAGRNDTVPVLIIGSDKIDITKPLSEQQELLLIKEMSREEYELFNGTIATNLADIKGAKLKFPLQVGSPVLMSALTKTDTAGTFAASTPIYHTIFKMPEIIGTLPPGIQAGDLVDINLLIQKEEKDFVIGRLLEGIKVAGVETETATVYLMVSQKEYDMLALSRQIGSFVVQLPGQKEVGTCDEVKANLTKDKQNEIIELTTKNESYKNLSEADQAKMVKELEDVYNFRIATAECVDPSDKPTTITSQSIKDMIENGTQLTDLFDDIIDNLPKDQLKENETENNTENNTNTNENTEETDDFDFFN